MIEENFNKVEKLASAVYNNVVSGLSGYNSNPSISMEQLEDAVIDERLQIIKEYSIRGLLNYKDLYISINCIPVDCNTSLERCSKCLQHIPEDETKVAHFEIPQLINDLGDVAISYIGSTDRMNPFVFYTSTTALQYRKYRKRKQNKPYVWIDTTPNENEMYDCFLFNAPFVTEVSVVGAFKDLRQLCNNNCSNNNLKDHKSFLDATIVDRLTKKMLLYYRQYHMPPHPNDQTYKP